MVKARILLSALLLSQNLWAFDLVAGAKEVLQVVADTADLNQKKHRGTYTGHVQFSQGTSHLWAASAMTQGDEQNKLIVAIVHGSKGQQAHYWSQPSPDKPTMHAYADTMYYYPKRHLIRLQGRALVKQGDNSMAAATILYDTETQHVVSGSDHSRRTTLILHPEKKAS